MIKLTIINILGEPNGILDLKKEFDSALKSIPAVSKDLLIDLLTKVYKYIHGLSPEIMNKVFSTRANICNTRQFNVFEAHIPTSNRYGLNSIP